MTTYASYYLLSPACKIYHKPSNTSASTSTPTSSTATPYPSRTSSFSSTTPLTLSTPTEKQPHQITSSHPCISPSATTQEERTKTAKWYDFLKPLDQPEPPTRIYEGVLRRPLFQRAKKGNERTILGNQPKVAK